jgi:predicted transcriptional regulator of viral defense system
MEYFTGQWVMTPKQEAQLKKLGPFSLSQAEKIGITQQELSRLVKEEKIQRMERGIYLHPKAKVSREIDFQIACTKFGPKAVVGGLTALFYYNLANQVPQQTWLLVPPEQRTSSKGYRLIRTKTPLNIGVVKGDGFRIVSIERAIAEGFKLASKIGERTAIKAARIAIQQKQTTLKKIGVMAKELGLDSYMTKYFEAIIGAIEG